MAIGSKVVGRNVVAGQYGIIDQADGLIGMNQTVQLVDPAATLATFEQSVEKIDKSKTLVAFSQRVVDSVEDVFVPYAYVEINCVTLTCSTAYNNVNIVHNENQSSTARMNVTYPSGMPINIPSFHGKSVKILVHSDPDDINSELIPLFTGWVESAKHDLNTQSINFICSDLRDERLGREGGQEIKQLTGALYSTITQREEVSGREYITELMKTVTGSLGYTRSGDLRYYSWGVGNKPVNLTLTGDVEYESLETDFQTRSSVVNSVSVNMRYRWNSLRSIYTQVDAYKPRKFVSGESCVSYGTQKVCRDKFDHKAFRKTNLITRLEDLQPWQTLDYSFYPLERLTGGTQIFVFDVLWMNKDLWSQGFTADLVRHIAQPVTEEYTFTVTAPQSVDAYSETVEGTELSFAAEVEYERSDWEQDFIEADLSSVSASKAAEQSKADSRREDLENAFNAAYRIAKKQIVSSHRNNYVDCVLKRIQPLDVGDIVEHNSSLIQTTGQCVGLEYNIENGDISTSIRVSISYMDTDVAPPVEDWSAPSAPALSSVDVTLESTAEYVSDDGAFDIKLPDISEQITDEYKPVIPPLEYKLPLEINNITLINGY